MIDKFTILPIVACVFAIIIGQIEGQIFNIASSETRLDTRVFWPVMAAISIGLAAQNRSRLPSPLPPHIVCLLVYLAYAGSSVVWTVNPRDTSVRFAQEAMVVTATVLPLMLAAPTSDVWRALFRWCLVPAAVLNVFFVLNNSPHVVEALKGYPGYFNGKNYLGEFSALPFILGLREILYPGSRRVIGVIGVGIATWLLVWANSKTAFGLALLVPGLAGATLFVRKMTRVSLAVILLTIPVSFILLSQVSNLSIERLSYMIYGDSSLTGRTVIWDFVNTKIALRPLLGWGYQSFWLAGPGAPSADAPGWVGGMPDGHNGYVDTKGELGYVGLALLLTFVLTTLHGVGRIADRDPIRAWSVLSIALYVILYNFLESLWMRGYEFLWVMFLLVVAEAARYSRDTLFRRAAYGSASRGPGRLGVHSDARLPRRVLGRSS